MARKHAQNTREDAAAVLKVLAPATTLAMQDLTLDQFQQKHDTLAQLLDTIQQKETQAAAELTPLRNQRDDLTAELQTDCARARSAIKGHFGANSSEYELAGGTRASDIKRRSSRREATAPATAIH